MGDLIHDWQDEDYKTFMEFALFLEELSARFQISASGLRLNKVKMYLELVKNRLETIMEKAEKMSAINDLTCELDALDRKEAENMAECLKYELLNPNHYAPLHRRAADNTFIFPEPAAAQE